MRFITEFEVPEKFHGDPNMYPRNTDRFIYNNKERSVYEIGEMIDRSFGWQNPVNNNALHHRLEIEAFPMDKWVEFKDKLKWELIGCNCDNTEKIIGLIKELESFGKPVKPR
jgi:hypothetical protein